MNIHATVSAAAAVSDLMQSIYIKLSSTAKQKFYWKENQLFSEHQNFFFMPAMKTVAENIVCIVSVKTNRSDARRNSDVTSKTDRFEQCRIVPLPVHIDSRLSKSFCYFPRVFLWIPAKQNSQKIEILQIQDGSWTPYWKSVFGNISATYWPINAKFGSEMKNHRQV